MNKKEFKTISEKRTLAYQAAMKAFENDDFSVSAEKLIEVINADYQMIREWHLGSRNQLTDSLQGLAEACENLAFSLYGMNQTKDAINIYQQEIGRLSELTQERVDYWQEGYTGFCLFTAIASLNLNLAVFVYSIKDDTDDEIVKSINTKEYIQQALSAAEKWLLLPSKLTHYIPGVVPMKYHKKIQKEYLAFLSNDDV